MELFTPYISNLKQLTVRNSQCLFQQALLTCRAENMHAKFLLGMIPGMFSPQNHVQELFGSAGWQRPKACLGAL